MSQEIQDLLDELGLTLEVEGQPKPRTDDNWCGVTYNVALYKEKRLVLRTDYTMGTGHFPLKWETLPMKYTLAGGNVGFTRQEQGFYYQQRKKPYATYKDETKINAVRASIATKIAIGEKILPDIKDVVYCFMNDASVLDHESFEDWAGNFGYDTDSRKAEEIYNACPKIALAFRNKLGRTVLTQLQEAYQDY